MTLNVREEGDDSLRKELNLEVRKDIGAFAAPDKIHFTPALPKTRSGKIMRRILRKIAEGATSGLGDTSTLADPTVRRCLARRPPVRLAAVATIVLFAGTASAAPEAPKLDLTQFFSGRSHADNVLKIAFHGPTKLIVDSIGGKGDRGDFVLRRYGARRRQAGAHAQMGDAACRTQAISPVRSATRSVRSTSW